MSDTQQPPVELRKCPRCDAEVVNTLAATSRTTRDDGAEILVCQRCGKREALYGRDPADQVPYTEWPVSVERLVAEERALIEQWRDSTLTWVPTDDMEILDQDDDEEATDENQ